MKRDDCPRISIIVPIYKVEAYLNQCVDSILSQSYREFELILVDDGSPDDCGAICEEYALHDDRIIVIHRKNGGLSAARNTGMEIARGEYLFFVDSDDLIAPDILERMMRIMLREKASMVMCRKCDFKESQQPEVFPGKDTPDSVEVITGRELCIRRFDPVNRILISAWGKLFHRSLWDGHVFPTGKIHEDQFVIPIIMYQAEKVAIMNSELYFYRLRKGSITSVFTRNHFDNIEGMDLVLRYYQERGDRQLVKLLKKHRSKTLAQYVIQAKQNGINELPLNCQMRINKALWILWRTSGDEQFSEKLTSLYPKVGKIYLHYCALKRKLRGWLLKP